MHRIACPICGEDAERLSCQDFVYHLLCPVCHDFSVSRLAYDYIRDDREITPRKYLLSGRTREFSEAGAPLILRTYAEAVEQLEQARKPLGMEAVDTLLRYVRSKTESADRSVKLISGQDYPVIYATGPSEFSQVVRWALDQGYLMCTKDQDGFSLTLNGWTRVSEIGVMPKVADQAFVAMWFSDEVSDAYADGLRPALKHCGYHAVRIDKVEHNEEITDKIIAEIRKSGLLIADFTGHRAGVYFEAGFALGLGLPVIWTCRHDQIDKCHFDTRQYNHIVWKDPGDLKQRLIDRIEATIPNRPKR